MATLHRSPLTKRTPGVLTVMLAALLVLGGLTYLFAREGDVWPSVWDGVYTSAQSTRGEAAYRANCASCHGAKLEGQGRAPALTGRDFKEDWDLMGVDNLFEKILFTMPRDRQGELSAAQEAEILAYILKFNQFPAGRKELPADAEQLRVVLFEADRAPR